MPAPTLEGMSTEEIQSLALLAKTVRDNPQTRRTFLKTVKQVNPELNIPELDLEEQAMRLFQDRDKQSEKLAEELAAERQLRQARDRIDALKDAGVVSSTGEFNDLVKFAHEKGYQTSDEGLKLAAEARRRETAAAVPTPSTLFPRPDTKDKGLMRDPQKWARDQAAQAMDEILRGRRN